MPGSKINHTDRRRKGETGMKGVDNRRIVSFTLEWRNLSAEKVVRIQKGFGAETSTELAWLLRVSQGSVFQEFTLQCTNTPVSTREIYRVSGWRHLKIFDFLKKQVGQWVDMSRAADESNGEYKISIYYSDGTMDTVGMGKDYCLPHWDKLIGSLIGMNTGLYTKDTKLNKSLKEAYDFAMAAGGVRLVCPDCEEEYEKGKFCIECGHRLRLKKLPSDAYRPCPYCGAKCEKTEKICDNCGASLSQGNSKNPGSDCGKSERPPEKTGESLPAAPSGSGDAIEKYVFSPVIDYENIEVVYGPPMFDDDIDIRNTVILYGPPMFDDDIDIRNTVLVYGPPIIEDTDDETGDVPDESPQNDDIDYGFRAEISEPLRRAANIRRNLCVLYGPPPVPIRRNTEELPEPDVMDAIGHKAADPLPDEPGSPAEKSSPDDPQADEGKTRNE